MTTREPALNISGQLRRSSSVTEEATEPPSLTWVSLFQPPKINSLNGKSYTLPIFTLSSPHARNFHLSWLGFFVAFLSWFAFPPLIPEAIKTDLNLTTDQIGNSNIVALCSTLVIRFIIGPLVDRFGPRKCMAGLLILGAIPSGLTGTITSVEGLYVIRFFIGILGATFVPCQAWTTAFFDKSVVGRANAFAGGWGNAGGGVTFVVQIALFNALVGDGLSSHSAWRASFAIVPVPILLTVAILTLVFGTDCPAGKWSERHTLPATAIAVSSGHQVHLDDDEKRLSNEGVDIKSEAGFATVVRGAEDSSSDKAPIDIAVSETLSLHQALNVIISPYTWLPALAYFSTFGFELAVDSNLSNVLFAAHKSSTFGQTKAGYLASLFGFLNVVTRPFGGYLGDLVYRRFGVRGKKYCTIGLGFLQGAMSLTLGLYQNKQYDNGSIPSLSVQMGLIALMAIFCEMANGANFSLVPHCNPFNNGVMSGLVGGFGNLGGIFFALIFRFRSTQAFASAWWISGILAMAINGLCVFIPTPKL